MKLGHLACETMRIASREVLKRAISGKGSPLFLSKNASDISSYLKKKGFDIEIGEIKEYLAEQKSSSVVIKNNSERKISEVSRPYIIPPNFFEWINVDLCVLSRNHGYGRGSTRYVMVMVCGLSLYTYYAPCYSTKGDSVVKCFESIFQRSEYLPERAKKCFGDGGVEWNNNVVKSYLLSKGIRFYAIKPKRLERKGRGNVFAEVSIRLLRAYLEKYQLDVGNDVSFGKKLLEIEKTVNAKARSSLNGISSNEALTYNPNDIRNVKAGNRFRRRKSLRRNVEKPARLPLFSIVKVRRYGKKDIFEKEAYGTLSKNFYCVVDVVNYDMVYYHLLASVFDLNPVSDSKFSHAELRCFPELTVPKARYLNVLHSSEIVSRDSMYVYLKPEYCKETFYATKNALE